MRADTDDDDIDPLPLTGYGQTKVVAEALTRVVASAHVDALVR